MIGFSEALAQDSTIVYKASLVIAGASSNTPFWVSANQNGSIPATGNFTIGQGSVYKIYNPGDPRIFQWSAGAEAIASYSSKPRFFFSDLFATLKIGKMEILAGQKRNFTGLADTLLTSGSLSVSENSRPYPRLQIALADFHPLSFTNNFIAVKASYSDGLLHGSDINYGSVRYVPTTYLHQKTLYIQLGKQKGIVTGFVGMNHQVIWGGENKINPVGNISKSEAYWHTVTGKTYDFRKTGNHFGTIDLGIRWKRSDWSYFLYRQNIYDTGSLFSPINFTDGLNGLSIKRNKRVSEPYFAISSILLEILGTKDQTNNSPFSGLAIFEKGNYYNHYIYGNGYSYFGRAIGTPLISNKNSIEPDGELNASEFTNNNRFWSLHSGITASWLNTNFLFKGTYSRNFGTYISPFQSRRDQISAIITAERKLKGRSGIIAFTSMAMDIGSLYHNSASLLVGVRKTGFLN